MSNERPARDVDPVTLEVVRSSFPAIANEMAHVIKRTSFNMMLYEVGDFSCAILDRQGQLLAQNEGGVAHFLADIGAVIVDALARDFQFNEGDVYLANHEAYCGQHLNNVCAYMPVFHDGELVAFTIVRAHWIDVGGQSTGSGAGTTVADPWLEGLQLDQICVQDANGPRRDILRLISDNIRYPDSSFGDLAAQIAACSLGIRRVTALYRSLGAPQVEAAIEAMMADSEARCREIVDTLPDGRYTAASTFNDHATDGSGLLEIVVEVTIDGSDMTIDFTGSSDQRSAAVNARTLAGAYIAYKAITSPSDPVNEGSFRALRVVIPEGCFMMAPFPAPMASWSIALPTVVDTVIKAFGGAVPGGVPAGHKGALGDTLTFRGGPGRGFVAHSKDGGGWGGGPHGDGESATVAVVQGDVHNAPIEALELKFPVLVESRALRPNSGGAGKFRGGLGMEIVARNFVPGVWDLGQTGRKGIPPWGERGGANGGDGDRLVRLPGSSRLRSVDDPHYRVPAGATAVVRTAGGGGWGSPLERDPEAVAADVIDGLVTKWSARQEYGVVVRRVGGSIVVDHDATAHERALRLVAAPAPHRS